MSNLKKMRRLNRPKLHTPGQVRFFTYFLIWPGGNDYWVNQTPFVHDLEWELQQSQFKHNPDIVRDLLQKGETVFLVEHPEGTVTHRIVIESIKRETIWGMSEEERSEARRERERMERMRAEAIERDASATIQ